MGDFTINGKNVITQSGVDEPVLASNVSIAGGFVNRNLIINGGMQVWQRASAAVQTANAFHTVDHWKMYKGSGAYTSEHHAMSLSELNTTGHGEAVKLQVTTADASVDAGDYAQVSQFIEGQSLQHLQYGTSNAKTLTLSFWVKSNKTGIYCVALGKSDTTSYMTRNEFTISAANAWEKKTITITPTAGSTTLITNSGGVIDNDIGEGMHLSFILMMGTNYQGANDTWTTGSNYATSSQVNWMDSTSNNFYLTGVQLELGSGASPFEYRTFQDALLACQRYYFVLASHRNYIAGRTSNTDAMDCAPSCPVRMRSTPSVGNLGSFAIDCIHTEGGATSLNNQPTMDTYPTDGMGVGNTVGNMQLHGGSGLTDGRVCCARINGGLTFNADF